jgi:multidrug transporter EmrE-like cation transporter
MEQLMELALAYALVVGIGAACIIVSFIFTRWALETIDKGTQVDLPAPTIRYPVTHRQSS